MKSQDLLKNESEGDPKQQSLLFSLWRKLTSSSAQEEGKEEEASSEEELASPAKAPFEKTMVPAALAQLYIRWKRQLGEEYREGILVEDLCTQPHPKEELLERFFSQAEAQAQKRLDRYDSLCRENEAAMERHLEIWGKGAEREEDAARETEDAPLLPPALDGETLVFAAPDWSAAWCMVFPPLGEGKPAAEDGIRSAIEKKGISFGVIDGQIKRLASPENSLAIFPVAAWVPPVPGKDGTLTEHFQRDIGTPHFIEDAKGMIDFDNLNWLVPIDAGTVICDITMPTKGHSGTDIRGRVVKPYDGKKPVLPMGENVVLNSEGTALVAKVGGQISFKGGKFHVANTITIPGNVDLSTGSLDVRGDLVICGNVLAGFHVQASGNITIGGIVEGSQVTAGGTIIVNRGMNGNLVGSLIAGKDIFCKYMENASVQAEGDIHMDSIVNCDVSCNGKLIVRSGRGVIIGGTALAMGGIEAKIIGNKAGRLTVLSIGPTLQFLREKEKTEKELETVELELKKLRLSAADGGAALNLRIAELKQSKLKKTMEDLSEKEALSSQSCIRVGKLYPIVQVSINSVVKSLFEPCGGCRIYLDSKGGDVVVSSR